MPQTKNKGGPSKKASARRRAVAGIREPLSPEIRQKIGEALQQRRKEIGLSQSDVAKAIGYKSSTVWNVEAGRRDPWLDLPKLKWETYLRVLGLTEDELARMIGYEDASIFYGRPPDESEGNVVHLKKIQDVDAEGNPAGILVLGLPELDAYREKDLFVYRTPMGIRVIMTKVNKPKSELTPGDLVLIDEGEGKYAAYRFYGWTNTRPNRMLFSRGGEKYALDEGAVVGRGVLTIGTPEMRL